MVLPTDKIRGYLKAAAESIGMSFFYGRDADDFMRKLEAGTDLTTDGHFLLRDTTDNIQHNSEGWETIPCKAVLQMQTDRAAPLNPADVVATSGTDSVARIDHRTDMYNAWIDILAYIEDNYTDAAIQSEWDYRFFSFGDNVTEGIMVDFNMYVCAYDC